MRVPEFANFKANASSPPAFADCIGRRKGKSEEVVCPTMYAEPPESTAIAFACSSPDPPKYVLNRGAVPSGNSTVTNASRPPFNLLWYGTTKGKLVDVVHPVTQMLPVPSTAMPLA